MTKRRASSGSIGSPRATKRSRLATGISSLSDELLVRILRSLPLQDLLPCARVSRRFNSVAGDSQLWRPLYHERFVQPRLEKTRSNRKRFLGKLQPKVSKFSRWLDDDNLIRPGNKTHWKKQYKLRHNWAKGACDVTEIPVANRPPTPPILAKLHKGIVFTVDTVDGLRAFRYRRKDSAVGQLDLPSDSTPTCLAIDSRESENAGIELIVGFEDGSLLLFRYNPEHACFYPLHSHNFNRRGFISSAAFAFPYILTMTESNALALDKLNPIGDSSGDIEYKVERLATLHSHNTWPPMALSLRKHSTGLVVSVAYSIPTYTAGWSAGIQELILSSDGQVKHTRLATATEQGFTPSNHGEQSPTVRSTPTFLSYSHPYLLVSHSDNTMMLYLVNSGKDTLSISLGRRLWGHTSGIFGADVGKRGRAVSVSSSGEEVRVWELEGSMAPASRKPWSDTDLSVQVTPTNRPSPLKLISDGLGQGGNGLALALENMGEENAVLRGWVGFDEENVVVLRERASGCQSLAIYDFR